MHSHFALILLHHSPFCSCFLLHEAIAIRLSSAKSRKTLRGARLEIAINRTGRHARVESESDREQGEKRVSPLMRCAFLLCFDLASPFTVLFLRSTETKPSKSDISVRKAARNCEVRDKGLRSKGPLRLAAKSHRAARHERCIKQSGERERLTFLII